MHYRSKKASPPRPWPRHRRNRRSSPRHPFTGSSHRRALVRLRPIHPVGRSAAFLQDVSYPHYIYTHKHARTHVGYPRVRYKRAIFATSPRPPVAVVAALLDNHLASNDRWIHRKNAKECIFCCQERGKIVECRRSSVRDWIVEPPCQDNWQFFFFFFVRSSGFLALIKSAAQRR